MTGVPKLAPPDLTAPTLSLAQSLAQSLAPSPMVKRGNGEAKAYDFKRPSKLSRDHVRVLHIAMESFARGVTSTLTGALRTGARMDLVGIEQFGYDDYVSTLPEPVFMSIFGLQPLAGQGSFTFTLDTAMAMLDHLTGGPGNVEQPKRPMTPMETLLVSSLLEKILRELSSALNPITPFNPGLGSFEYNPHLAQVAAASETVIIGRFDLRVGARSCEATLCIPFNHLAEALQKAASPQLSEREKQARKAAVTAMTARLEQVPVDVTVRLIPVAVPTDDLVRMEVGNVIMLRHPRNVPLELTAADVTFAHAIPANHRRRLAAEIVPTPQPTNRKDGTRP
ncbi:flagellar motor switch protein FliM [Tessaracoccus sp.]